MSEARYWRIVGVEAYDGGDLELSALHLYSAAGRVDATATLTSSHAPIVGTLAALQDEDTATVCRFAGDAVRSGGFALVWDFGAGKSEDVTSTRPGGGASSAAFMAGCVLQSSSDAVTWGTLSNLGRYPWPGANTMSAAPATEADGDADFASVSLLLHAGGVDGSTTFVDSGPTLKSVTAYGNAKISTAQSKWGGSSLYVDGTLGSRLEVTPSSAVNLGVNDFTIEAWVNLTDAVSDGYIWCIGAYGTSLGAYGGVGSNGTTVFVSFGRFNPYASEICSFTVAKSSLVSAWHHIAWVRRTGVANIYIDGAQVATGTAGDNFSPAIRFRVGALNNYFGPDDFSSYNYSFNGYIDDFRVTAGVARYTADFTSPTIAFPSTAGGGSGGIVFEKAPLRSLRSDLSIAASTPVPAHNTAVAPRLQLARDIEFGGAGTVYGTAKTKSAPPTPDVPTKSRVVLLHQRSKLLVRETWSDPVTGAFVFAGIDTRQQFLALAEDAEGYFRPVAANRLTPEVL